MKALLRLLDRGKERRQKVLRFCEDRHIRFGDLPICDGYVKNDEDDQAWFSLHSQQTPMEGEEGMVLVVTERDRVPINPFNTLDATTLKAATDTTPIARQQLHKTYQAADRQSARDRLAGALYFAVMAIVIAFVGLLIYGIAT